jgi:hypothetical protein
LGSTGWKAIELQLYSHGRHPKEAGRETIHAGNYLSMKSLTRWCAHLFAVLILGVSGAAIPSFGQELPQQDTSKPEQSATQTGNESSTPPAQAKPEDQEPPGGKRVFGVLPNYRTADASQEGVPISAGRKFKIAAKDSFDYPLVILGGALAGLGQLTNQDPAFGQGVKGFAHRLVTNYADQAMGNMFTEGLFPALFHEDPRYFRRGTGGTMKRAGYALSRVIVTDTDSGHKRFNFSEWVGNASAVAISNTYYPDNRTATDNVLKLLEQVGTDAASQVLKEFWPDIKQKFFHKGPN